MRALLMVFLVVSLVAASITPALARSPKDAAARYSVEALTLRVFNRVTNKIVPFDKQPNDYGMDMDVLVAVRVRATATGSAAQPFDVELSVDYPKTEGDEAGNAAMPARRTTQIQKGLRVPDQGVGHYLFVIPFDCGAPTITAHVVGSNAATDKSLKANLGCAE